MDSCRLFTTCLITLTVSLCLASAHCRAHPSGVTSTCRSRMSHWHRHENGSEKIRSGKKVSQMKVKVKLSAVRLSVSSRPAFRARWPGSPSRAGRRIFYQGAKKRNRTDWWTSVCSERLCTPSVRRWRECGRKSKWFPMEEEEDEEECKCALRPERHIRNTNPDFTGLSKPHRSSFI